MPPVWLMRQAGRYLPEYRALRAEKGGFLELVYDSEAAAEITLQPIRRFGFDGAILFSDILVVPHALGQDLSFEAGEGPRLSPPLVDHAARRARQRAPERLAADLRDRAPVAAALPPETTLLGFAGSPWTVATYMVAGQGSRDQAETRRLAYRDPAAFRRDHRCDRRRARSNICRGQIEAGVEAVQLFDSWAGSLVAGAVRALGDRAHRARSSRRCTVAHPGVPVIGFPKGAGGKLPAYARETGVDAIGLDETVDPAWAARESARRTAGAGQSRSAGADRRRRRARSGAIARILEAFADRPHMFNLGHGILPGHADRACRAAAGAASRRTADERVPRRRLSLGQGGASSSS